MSELGLLSYYLGIKVEQMEGLMTLKQLSYAKKVLLQFRMNECNATQHPMEYKQLLHKDSEREPVNATEYMCVISYLRYILYTQPNFSYTIRLARRY